MDYILLTYDWKKQHNHTLNNFMLASDEFLIQEKIILFSCMVSYCNQELRF